MARKIAALCVLLLLCGCEQSDPFHGSKTEELRYLRALSNPTPEQFERRQNLESEVGRDVDALDKFDEVRRSEQH